MQPFFQDSALTIYHGNAPEVLRTLPDESANCCVTSPPYWGLRDYGTEPHVYGGNPSCEHEWMTEIVPTEIGKGNWTQGTNGCGEQQPGGCAAKREPIRAEASTGFCLKCGAWLGSFGLEPTPELYVDHAVMIFREIRRVLQPDGTLWLNLGDCYATGAGRVGNCPGGGDQGKRWRDPTLGGYRETRQGDPKNGFVKGPLVQPNRMPLEGLKPKDLVGIPWMVAFALRADGWYLRSEIIWHKPNPMPESVKDRPTTAHERIFLMSKAERYYYDYEAVKESAQSRRDERPFGKRDSGEHGQSGRVYTAKSWNMSVFHKGKNVIVHPNVGKKRKPAGRDTGKGRAPEVDYTEEVPEYRNRRSVWTVPTAPYSGAHFATFPPDLIIPCILAGCPAGGTVLDPFAGTGTTGKVAERFERKAVLIDLNDKYLELMKRRNNQRSLIFNNAKNGMT